METIVSVVLVLLTFCFIVYPFFKRMVSLNGTTKNTVVDDVTPVEKFSESRYREMEVDYQIGKLSEQDFHDVTMLYEQSPASTLEKPDVEQSDEELAQRIEEAVISLRRNRNAVFCPDCGARCEPADRFCASCGTSISRETDGE